MATVNIIRIYNPNSLYSYYSGDVVLHVLRLLGPSHLLRWKRRSAKALDDTARPILSHGSELRSEAVMTANHYGMLSCSAIMKRCVAREF